MSEETEEVQLYTRPAVQPSLPRSVQMGPTLRLGSARQVIRATTPPSRTDIRNKCVSVSACQDRQVVRGSGGGLQAIQKAAGDQVPKYAFISDRETAWIGDATQDDHQRPTPYMVADGICEQGTRIV